MTCDHRWKLLMEDDHDDRLERVYVCVKCHKKRILIDEHEERWCE